MSRSFKKVPIIKDATCKKYGKKYANKKVRHVDIDSGSSYKKVYENNLVINKKVNELVVNFYTLCESATQTNNIHYFLTVEKILPKSTSW